MTFSPARLSLADIGHSIRNGRELRRTLPGVSLAYAAVFTLFGLVLLTAIVAFGLSPMVLPFAGGFMLLGPVLLTGYFEIIRLHEKGTKPGLGDALRAFRRAPAPLWMLAMVCALLFLIWITDAGILYSFTIGGIPISYDITWLREVLAFELWGSLMGSVIAVMIFSVSAFSVPLIHEGRCGLVQAVSTSVGTVFRNFLVCLCWGLVLGTVIMTSILLLPLLLITLPVMSYASYFLYRAAFPPQQAGN